MTFRKGLGILCAVIGSLALIANTYILGTSAMEWAHEGDDKMRIAYAVGGAIVPWFLAVAPMIMGMVSVARTWFQKALRFFVIVFLWSFFFGYNLIMGASTASGLRENRVAEHGHQVERLEITRERRKQLKEKLASIPQHRPVDTVSAEIDALKISKTYTNSIECADPTTKGQRDTCQTLEKLKGEYAAAVEAAKVEEELTKADDAIGAAPSVSADNGDPFVDFMSSMTGLAPKWVRVIQSMLTPIGFELLGATMWHWAVVMFGWRIRPDEDEQAASPKKGASKPADAAAMIPTKDAMDRPLEASLGQITHQRRICENFFKNCVRFSANGHLPERDWYEHYQVMCERSRDVPLPVESFRRIAAVHVPSIQQLGNGETYYSGVLPLVSGDA